MASRACHGVSPSITARSFTIPLRRRRFRPACISGCWPWASTSASPASAVPPTMPRLGRTHQTMTLQALLGQRLPDQPALWAGLDARRAMLNQHIPSWVFQGHAPLHAYPAAAHSGRFYRLEWEAEMLDLDRVFQYLANCRWFRRVRANGRLDIGGYDYYLGTSLSQPDALTSLRCHPRLLPGAASKQLEHPHDCTPSADENRSDART